jgi:chromosome segregation ATPase
MSHPVAETQNKLNRLQTELGMLHEKQTSAIADLSLARAAKRRAEDDVREERSIRRRLERDLRTVEDALKRSKRMESAALDQIKREVDARRKAENRLAELKAENHESPRPIADPSSMLLHLVSVLRNVNPIDHPTSAGPIPSFAPSVGNQLQTPTPPVQTNSLEVKANAHDSP